MSRKNPILVFDIGGVFVELGGMPRFREWTAIQPEEIRKRWLASEVVRKFESGRLSFDDFASAIIKEFQIPLSLEGFREEFKSWLSVLFPKAGSILRALNERYMVACLCNMNPIQWPRIRDELELGQYFQHQFLSYEIGMVKPDREVYEHVTDALKTIPERIVFFDDSKVNIDGAIEVGWSAHLVQGTEQLMSVLSELKLL